MLPELFMERMKGQLGREYPAYLESLERPRAVALRFAPGKEVKDLPLLGDAVPWEALGYYYDPEARPGLHPYHECGVYYLQEASAMSAVALLDPQPGERICDLCAAPGGKSTQIAGRLKGEGLLISNEYSSKRAKILSQNIERMGVANAIVTNSDTSILAKKLPGFFHRVLVDAPCSGEGMFRKEEAAITDWSQETVQMCAARQQEILNNAAQLVMPGGRLVYSTCTFAPEENEEMIAWFLETHPEFAPKEVSAPWFTAGPNGSFRLWPHKLLGEGHFVAVLEKTGGEEGSVSALKGEKAPKEWESFGKELGIRLPAGKFLSFGSNLYYVPEETPALDGMRVLRAGLSLGEVKKGRFEPDHGLALWLGSRGPSVSFAADSPQVKAYIHGETVAADHKGWCVFCVDGFGLGWAKGDGKILKNHYPKGLRR